MWAVSGHRYCARAPQVILRQAQWEPPDDRGRGSARTDPGIRSVERTPGGPVWPRLRATEQSLVVSSPTSPCHHLRPGREVTTRTVAGEHAGYCLPVGIVNAIVS